MGKYLILLVVFSFLLLPSFVLAIDSVVSIPAGTTRRINLYLRWGDTVDGSITVSGGILHKGVDVWITDSNGNTILDLGTVTDHTRIRFSGGFVRGNYELVLYNPSWVSDKTVTFSYNIYTDPLMHYNYEIIIVIVAIVAIAAVVYLRRRAKRIRIEKSRKCPSCGQTVSISKTKCPYCGFDIALSTQCKYCNTFYDRSLTKCPNCGAKTEK
jgi:hypothetical protein